MMKLTVSSVQSSVQSVKTQELTFLLLKLHNKNYKIHCLSAYI